MKEASKESVLFDLVEKWQKSGKSQKKFSSENNVRFHTFSYWVQRYRQSRSTNPGFASVTLSPENICLNPYTQSLCEILSKSCSGILS